MNESTILFDSYFYTIINFRSINSLFVIMKTCFAAQGHQMRPQGGLTAPCLFCYYGHDNCKQIDTFHLCNQSKNDMNNNK